MIIPYNVSSDWSRESRDCANKTSCLPGKNIISHHFGSLVIFHTKCRKKLIGHTMLTNKSLLFNHLNSLYATKTNLTVFDLNQR